MLFVLLQRVKCIIDVQDLMTGSVIVENFSELNKFLKILLKSKKK